MLDVHDLSNRSRAPRAPRAAAHVGPVGVGGESGRVPDPVQIGLWVRAVGESGDRRAFAALFRHFAPRIKAYLMRSGSNEALAEELTQETMVTLWRRASSFDPERARLSTWLFTIARNLRIDHLRRAGLPEADGDARWDADQIPADAGLAPDALVLAAERERRVHAALAQLPSEQAQVLRLSFFEERPHSQIARELDIPLGTVKSRVRLAVAQLRRFLDRSES
ncbi:MAG: sigma-70 family RNA polymerase sigma factor [Burkholderiaceae bacterium]